MKSSAISAKNREENRTNSRQENKTNAKLENKANASTQKFEIKNTGTGNSEKARVFSFASKNEQANQQRAESQTKQNRVDVKASKTLNAQPLESPSSSQNIAAPLSEPASFVQAGVENRYMPDRFEVKNEEYKNGEKNEYKAKEPEKKVKAIRKLKKMDPSKMLITNRMALARSRKIEGNSEKI